VVEIYTAGSLDRRSGRPISSSEKYIFSRTIASKMFGKMCYSCTYLIIITSEMIFIVFSAIFFFKQFLRNKIDPMPLRNNCVNYMISLCWFQQKHCLRLQKLLLWMSFKGIVSKLAIKFWMCQKIWQNERLQLIKWPQVL
jgi:hypothetical protein